MDTQINLFKFLKIFTVVLGLALLISACGSGGGEEQETDQPDQEATSGDDETTESSDGIDLDATSDDSEETNEETSTGSSSDEALNYKELQTYLPKNIKGYQAEGGPEGQSLNAQGMSFSQASQTYTKDGQEMQISIIDYHLADVLLGTIMAGWNMSFENDEEKAGSVSLKGGNLKGWEVYKKKDREATLSLAINERFLLNINAEGQDGTDFIKSVVEALDIDALMKM